MITEWFFSLVAGVMEGIAGMFPDWTPPDWFTDFGPQYEQIMAFGNGMAPWFNFALAGTVVAAILSTWVICFTIKLIMRAASHAPVFGGAG